MPAEAVSRLLEAWGGMVDRVAIATDAVEALTLKNYDAVMIDDSMDGTYSYEVARLIREDLKEKRTTIIIASADELDPIMAREAGADSCVQKPLNGRKLLDSLMSVVKHLSH